jgi:molecular chaperone HtpG
MAAETIQFETEVSDLLQLMVHSLYSDKDIFLRELVSNAVDAIDHLRFEALTETALNEGNGDWKIKLGADEANSVFTIEDNGVGMSRDDMISNLGTIARSGTKQFMEALKEDQSGNAPDLIGQFGVGFYSSFMVAEEVTVESRKAGEDKGHRWISTGDGKFTIEECDRSEFGTKVSLKLKEESLDYLQEHKIRELVTKYSNFVAHPICMDVTREEIEKDEEGKDVEGAEAKKVTTEEVLNAQEALWKRDKKEIKAEGYKEFYQQLTYDWNEPLETIHYKVEGTAEFTGLLYIPSKPPMAFMNPDKRTTLHLYINRVFIMKDNPDILPEYLDFVKGVVDSSDLPLNVSREILQNNKQLTTMRKSVVSKVLKALTDIFEKDRTKYIDFYKGFGRVFKQGVQMDFENLKKIQTLLLFESSQFDEKKMTNLEEYVSRMPEEQKDIYFLSGSSRSAVENSPHLESLKAKGFEILYLTEAIDEWVMTTMREFEGKALKSIESGDLNLSDEKDEEKDKAFEERQEEHKVVLGSIQETLKDDITEVRLSKRLTESACCLIAPEGQLSTHMEQTLRHHGQQVPDKIKRILELNPEHSLVKAVKDMAATDASDPRLAEYSNILYDQALLTAGVPVRNPVAFAKKMSELLAAEAKT